MGVTVDITARRAMLDKIRRQRARLERTSRVETLAELSASLAHELNQPLAMILTNAEAAQALLGQATPDLAELREILGDIVRADQRAADVIRRMRALLDRGEPERGALLLDDAILRVVHLLGHEIDEKGVIVTLCLAPDLPPVEADHILIEQVLVNLLSNACEAVAGNPAGERRVSIVTRADADRVLVEVTDNGCGLSDPHRIFDAFYSTKAEGLGMGLAIVRSIVSSHDGRVWAEAVPAGGTTFHVSLPSDGGSA
jgi:C4-dicarboxylate-specific signal transduction histidine kinase